MPQQDYESIGTRLRNNRLHHQLSIKEVAKHLHIRAQYLEALEEGNTQLMPDLVYAKGYLQCYAEFLGIENTPELVAAFEKAGVFPQKRLFHFPEHMDRSPDPSPAVVASSLAGALLVMLMWIIFAPKPQKVVPFVPFPVNESALKMVPNLCRVPQAPAYPPCYWQNQALSHTVFVNFTK